MTDLPIRLALVGPPDDVAVRAEVMRRVRGGQVSVIADSVEAALQAGGQFEAAVVRASIDVRFAIEAGRHVLVDAPFADSTKQAAFVIESAKQADVVCKVAGLPRHAPANQTIIDRLASGKLGDPGLLRVHRWTCHKEQSLAAKLFGDIDLAIVLFGAKPTDVYAIERGKRSYIQIHLGFPLGGMAVLDFSQRLPAGQDYDSLSLIGSTGAAYADDHHNTHLLFAGRNPTALISDSGNGHLIELQAFVDEIAQRSSPSIGGEAILTAHRVIDAVGRSIESTQVLQERGGVYEPA